MQNDHVRQVNTWGRGVFLTQNDHVRQGNYVGQGLVSCGQPRLHLKRAETQRSPILTFLSIYVYTLRRSTTEFGVVHTYREAHVLRGQPRHQILHNASRGLSAIAEFLVLLLPRILCFAFVCLSYMSAR